MNYSISYIIATRNRLPQLKITLSKLIAELMPDEEIVVVDSNSTDGAKEYLQHLFEDRKIHQYISEPDRNQAHGWNKAMLMANGTFIKKIIDDDVYCYHAIRKCRDFMLINPKVDLCISDCLVTQLLAPERIHQVSRLKQFKEWQAGITTSFTFSDVYMLIRNSSLSFIGLYDTQFVMLDWEYALRASFLKACIAYYTGCNSLVIDTPGNVTSLTGIETLKLEGEIGKKKYLYQGDRSDVSMYSEFKIAVGKMIGYKKGESGRVGGQLLKNFSDNELPAIYSKLYKHLNDFNRAGEFEFLF